MRVGDVEPWAPPQRLLGPAILDAKGEPGTAWFILRSAPQREVAACARLRVQGAADAWFPVEEVWRQRRGATRPVKVERRIAPGYLFTAWTHEPRWHLMRELTRDTVIGVVSIGDEPWQIPEATIARMAQVPERIEHMRRQEEARREAERRANQPAPGEAARFLSGPLEGALVLVESVRGQEAVFNLGGSKGTAALASLRRVA